MSESEANRRRGDRRSWVMWCVVALVVAVCWVLVVVGAVSLLNR